MAGKNKGGREVRKPKAAQPKNNASQPSKKGVAGPLPQPAPVVTRPGR